MVRYQAMQSHWTRVAPPAYVTSAALAGWKPAEPKEDNFVDDPADLAGFLATIPGGSVTL